jgi:hypothetical protein
MEKQAVDLKDVKLVKIPKKNRDRIKKWIAALRSGEYKQGTFALKKGDRYCCLGVACDIYRKTTKRGRWEEHPYQGIAEGVLAEHFVFGDGLHAADMALPGPVSKWFGDFPGADVYLGLDEVPAADLNDDGRTFRYIANRLERQYIPLEERDG